MSDIFAGPSPPHSRERGRSGKRQRRGVRMTPGRLAVRVTIAEFEEMRRGVDLAHPIEGRDFRTSDTSRRGDKRLDPMGVEL